MQVRGVDQTPVSSLGSDCQSCTAFLLKVVEKLKPQNLEKLRGGTGFTSIEMGSHTCPAAAGLFRTVLEEQRGHGNLRFQNA